MQIIKKITCVMMCLMVLIGLNPLMVLADVLPSGIDSSALKEEVGTYVENNRTTTAGLAMAVFNAEGMIYQDNFGYADLKNEFPVTDETVFEWGSASKTLIWVSVMQLVEDDLIDLEADIRRYLPDGFLNKTNFEEPITMLNLMNHTAGFQNVILDLFVPEGVSYGNLEETLLKNQPEQVYTPGTTTAYSNWGAALAAYIVERVSGESYVDYVHQHIFSPLQMEQTAIAADLSDNPWVREKRKALQGYTMNVQLIEDDLFYHIPLYPAGMGTGNLSDFARFASALLPGSGETSRLFKHLETHEEMFQATAMYGDSNIPRNAHGLWVEFYGVPVYGHSGNTVGCSSTLQLDIENGVGAVVMTNQSNEIKYNKEMLTLIFGAYEQNPLASNDETLPEGIFYDATTIKEGPLAISQLTSLREPSKAAPASFWMPEKENNVDKVMIPYRDLIRQDSVQAGLIAFVMLFWVVGVFYAFFSLLLTLLGVLLRAVGSIPKSGEGIVVATCPFEKWHMIACGVIVFGFVTFLQMVVQVFSISTSARIAWQLGFFAVVMVLLIAYIGWLGAKWKRMDCLRPEKIKYVVTAVFAGSSILFIVFWELYRFWAV